MLVLFFIIGLRILLALEDIDIDNQQTSHSGCIIVGNLAYTLEGSLEGDTYTRYLYKLDLNKKQYNLEHIQKATTPVNKTYPLLLAAENSNKVWLVGDNNSDMDSVFYELDIGYGKLVNSYYGIDKSVSLIISAVNGEGLVSHPYDGGYILSNGSKDYLYLRGMYENSNKIQQMFSSFIHSYNLQNKNWTSSTINTIPQTIYHTSHLYKNNLYMFGGLNLLDNKAINLTIIRKYNINDNSWNIVEVTSFRGEVNNTRLYLHSSILINNLVYLFGGNFNNQKINEEVYIIDLDSLSWKREIISGIRGRNNGCLINKDVQLIYKFSKTYKYFHYNSRMIRLVSQEGINGAFLKPEERDNKVLDWIYLVVIVFLVLLNIIGIQFHLFRINKIREYYVKKQLNYEEKHMSYNTQFNNTGASPLDLSFTVDDLNIVDSSGQNFNQTSCFETALNVSIPSIPGGEHGFIDQLSPTLDKHNVEVPREWVRRSKL